MSKPGAFLADMKQIRRRARQHLTEGAVTENYGGKVEETIALLNHAVATEIVCILRYKFHAVCATGLASEAVKKEFAQHAKEEEEHLDLLSERINQLGGKRSSIPVATTEHRDLRTGTPVWLPRGNPSSQFAAELSPSASLPRS